MSYKKALRKLEKLPIGERQLAAGQHVWEVKKGKSHCGCAIGKLLTERQRVRLFKEEANSGGVSGLMDFLKVKQPTDYGYVGSEDPSGILDLTYGEASLLQSKNDGSPSAFFDEARNSHGNRKARYKHVVAWLREQVAEESQPAAEDR